MRPKWVMGLLPGFLALGAIAAAPVTFQPGDQEPEEKKYSIREVMKLAHKDGLLKKVATGKASDKEQQRLVTLYKALAKNSPPRGEATSWKERTRALVEAAGAAVKGEEDASDRLLKASECQACHDLHK